MSAITTLTNKKSLPWLLLIGLTLFVYLQTVGYEFLNIDDDIYVTKNDNIKLFGTLEGLKWAFTYIGTANWHPLVWLSLMLDYKLFGMNPWGYHLHNVVLHLVNVLLLYWVLWKVTGATWRSFFVALLFSIHPMRVESVAWVTERKDVLSGFFLMGMFWGYICYVHSQSHARYVYYWAALVMFVLGLLSKATLVVAPILIILMDYWPLNRLPQSLSFQAQKSYWVEKIPFLALSFIFAIIAILVSKQGGANFLEDEFGILTRIWYSFVFYCSYMKLTFIPYPLSVYYPYPREGIAIWIIAASLLFLVIATIFSWLKRNKSKSFFVGWVWFVLSLLPMIGIVKAGSMPYSDRYTYIPHIGFFIMFVFGLYDFIQVKMREKRAEQWLGVGMLVISIMMTGMAWKQTQLWQNNRTLYQDILDRYENVYPIAVNMGLELKDSGEYEKALEYFQEAHAQHPRNDEPLFLIGWTYYLMGSVSQAEEYLLKTVNLNYTHAKGQKLLAQLYEEHGKEALAIRHYSLALKYQKDDELDATIPYNLANLLVKQNQYDQAEVYYLQAVQMKPDYVKAHYNLGNVYFGKKNMPNASKHYRLALTYDPKHSKARSMLEKVDQDA